MMVAQELVSSPLANPFFVLSARATLAELAVLRNDATASAEHYATLARGRSSLIALYICGDRVLGLLSQTMGNLDQAFQHFEDSLAFCRKAGYRPELAWTCCDFADMLFERNQPGDREKAVPLLDESLAISTELGMLPLMERAAALQERAESQPARAPTFPNGLTQREVDVLRLIALGKTNRQIGEELFISLNTVGHHVSNILSKMGSANRTEVATYAAQHGLTT